jgi:hypothetical protein
MSTPTPPRKPTDLVELSLTPQGPANGSVLARLAELIRESVNQARKKGSPKINLKKWEATNPDAAPTPLAEALGQAEDAIRDIAATSQQRAAELAQTISFPARAIDAATRIRAAEEQLRKTIEELVDAGIVPIPKPIVESPVVSERES